MTEPRVLLLTKGLDLGGLERAVVDLAVTLHRQGVSVEVALVNDDRAALADTLEQAGVPLHRLGGTDTIGPRAAVRFARLVRGGAYDVVHAHGPLPAVLARLASGNAKVVSTIHTMWGAIRRPTRVAWLSTAPLDAATVAVSEAVRASLPSQVAARATVIPHGVRPEAIQAARESAAAREPRAGPVTAITVASHRRSKDYPTLLKAMRVAIDAGADLRLVAIGVGPDLAKHRQLA